MSEPTRECSAGSELASVAATPHLVAFMVRHTSGFVAVALTGPACDRLELPPMCGVDHDPGRAAADRSRTIRLLADRRTTVADLSLPGHVAPLRAQPGGVLHRRDHVEAAVDLARLAGLEPAGVLCEIVSTTDPGSMARGAAGRRAAVPARGGGPGQHGAAAGRGAGAAARRRQTAQPIEE